MRLESRWCIRWFGCVGVDSVDIPVHWLGVLAFWLNLFVFQVLLTMNIQTITHFQGSSNSRRVQCIREFLAFVTYQIPN